MSSNKQADTEDNWIYSDKVRDHFFKPRNVMEDEEESFAADGEGMVGSPACGDMMKVWIKVKDDKIAAFKWRTFGCASAIATTSILSEMVIGKTLDEAYKITAEDIVKGLDGLPQNKIHCSVLGDQALRAAIDNYKGKINPNTMSEAKVICTCMGVTDEDIKKAVKDGAKNYEEVQEKTQCGTVCGMCEEEVKKIIKKAEL